MSRIVALGDSHLQRLGRRTARLACAEHQQGAEVVNVAVGGSTTADLAGQLERAEPGPGDRVLISVGTNDAASWYPVDLATAGPLLAGTLEDLAVRDVGRVVLLTTPGVDRSRLPQSNTRTESELREYADAFALVARAAGAQVLDAQRVLAPLGAQAFCEDGMHLSKPGYELLVPVMAAALCGCSG